MSHDEVAGHDSVLEGIPIVPVQAMAGDIPKRLPAKRPVLSVCRDEWRSWMVERGHPAYRAAQMLDWIIHKRANSFDQMSDLPKPLRHALDDEWAAFGTRVVYHDRAADNTDKLILACHDGRRIECVLMSGESRRNCMYEHSGWVWYRLCFLC